MELPANFFSMNSQLSKTLSDSAVDLRQQRQLRSALRPMLASLHQRAKAIESRESRRLIIKAYLKLADDCRHFELNDVALEALESALELKPSSTYLRRRLIEWFENNNRLEAAEELLSDSPIRPDAAQVKWSAVLARLHLRRGEYQKAVDFLAPILQMELTEKQESSLHFVYAQNLHKLGRYGDAFRSFERANQLRLSEDTSECSRHLALRRLMEVEVLNRWSGSKPLETL